MPRRPNSLSTPLSKRQRANIEKFKREGPKIYAKQLARIGLPTESWWLKPGPFSDLAKAEAERMRQSLMGRIGLAHMIDQT